MLYFYSPSTNAFYTNELHAPNLPGDNIPDDAVDVTDEEHSQLFAGQAAGRIIVPGVDGRPTLAEQEFDLDQSKAMQRVLMQQRYNDECSLNIAFTTEGGITKDFQSDQQSLNALQPWIAGDETPPGFYWKSADNTQVPFTVVDCRRLISEIQKRNWAAFQNLQVVKGFIENAKTPKAAKAVRWN